MNERDFLIWLKGFSEGINKTPNNAQWDIIQKKLTSSFEKIIPKEPVQNNWITGSYRVSG